MKKNRFLKTLKKIHKWPAISIAFIALLFALSGIVMNHRQTFSSFDISRNLLPSNYSYKNWNLSAVRSSLELDDGILVYGNVGAWKADNEFRTFDDFNQGFPKGIDNRKIYSIKQFNTTLFAGTHLGLYKREVKNGSWEKVQIPVKQKRIADLEIKNDSLLVLTRNYLLISTNGTNFKKKQLPEPLGYERKASLFNTFWELHSGEMFGLPGKLLVDLLGIVTIFLALTGLLHFSFPKWMKQKKRKHKPTRSLAKKTKTNLRWHNVAGYGFVLFLLLNTFFGIHLRPPLLIPIATKKVGIIPGTNMDTPNPWHDKLRRVQWDESIQAFLFSTSEGFYFADKNLSSKLHPAPHQPPVSIMGCNVLEPLGNMTYLVGSFSGMFKWDLKNGAVTNYFTGLHHQGEQGMSRPIAANAVAGLIKSNATQIWFDFNRGAINRTPTPFPEMPDDLRKKSPMSLWNVSLEIHTGRIFENFVGGFYILYVPLSGICLLLVLLSGFLIWWKVYRKRRKK